MLASSRLEAIDLIVQVCRHKIHQLLMFLGTLAYLTHLVRYKISRASFVAVSDRLNSTPMFVMDLIELLCASCFLYSGNNKRRIDKGLLEGLDRARERERARDTDRGRRVSARDTRVV